MTASRSLPDRPSLESLRKQAKKIARQRSVTLRDAQLILAREYGYVGWRNLIAEASKRAGNDLEYALAEARRAIHDNDIVVLKRLLATRPALLSWRGDERHQSLMEMATGAYGDAFGPEREHWFTRGTCAELLIDAGAVVLPRVPEGILQSRAVGLLHMAPEQLDGRKSDARSDIFSFGSVLYEMLTGRRAFPGDSGRSSAAEILSDDPKPVRQLELEIPAELENIVSRCLRKDPARRYQDIADVKVMIAAPWRPGSRASQLIPL